MRTFVAAYSASVPNAAVTAARVVSPRGRTGDGYRTFASENGRFAVIEVPDNAKGRPLIARYSGLIAVGEARITNQRCSLFRDPNTNGEGDLVLVLRAISIHGVSVIGELLGEFAFLVFDEEKDRLLVARDTFGIKRLFEAKVGNCDLFSSSADRLRPDSKYDAQYMAAYLSGLGYSATRTPWQGISAVRPGSYEERSCGRVLSRAFWPPRVAARKQHTGDEIELCAELLAHLKDAVKACIEPGDRLYSELSGGVDSATVLALSKHLHESGTIGRGVIGTYSYIDDMAGANETSYIDAILEKYPTPNARIANPYPWQDDGLPPPLTEEPRGHYLFWARDRKAEQIVRSAGCSIVLSGAGSDYYLTGSPLAIADHFARLHPWRALSEAQALASRLRGSTWYVLRSHGLKPLLRGPRSRLDDNGIEVPAWVSARLRRIARDAHRCVILSENVKHLGFATAEALRELRRAPELHELPLTEPVVEKRYPFLHRPLVEFVLSLPPELLLRKGTTKYILRAAIQGLVPNDVRERVTKGTLDGRLCKAFGDQDALITRMLKNPLSGQYGWVDVDQLRLSVSHHAAGQGQQVGPLLRVLALETWLLVRENRWQQMIP